jgi:hypothetical protein
LLDERYSRVSNALFLSLSCVRDVRSGPADLRRLALSSFLRRLISSTPKLIRPLGLCFGDRNSLPDLEWPPCGVVSLPLRGELIIEEYRKPGMLPLHRFQKPPSPLSSLFSGSEALIKLKLGVGGPLKALLLLLSLVDLYVVRDLILPVGLVGFWLRLTGLDK